MNAEIAIQRAHTLGRVAGMIRTPYRELLGDDPAAVVIQDTLATYMWEVGHLKLVHATHAKKIENAYQRGALGLEIKNNITKSPKKGTPAHPNK